MNSVVNFPLTPLKKKKGGVKRIPDALNKKNSDIFNIQTSHTQVVAKNNNSSENYNRTIEDRIKSISPYFNGKKNLQYMPGQLSSTVNLGEDIQSHYRQFYLNKTSEDHKKKVTPPRLIESQSTKRLWKTKSAADIGNNIGTPHVNEKSKAFEADTSKKSLMHHQKKIDSASRSLINLRDTMKDNLIHCFERCRSTFDESQNFIKDHNFERTKRRNSLRESIEKPVSGMGNIRHMIYDYHEKNENYIRSKSTCLTIDERKSLFDDWKKISEHIYRESEKEKEYERNRGSMIRGKRSDILIKNKVKRVCVI